MSRSTLTLPVTFPTDHINHAESRHDVGYHVALDHLMKSAHSQKTGRSHAHPIGAPGAIADKIKTQFPVAALHREVRFTWRHLYSFHDDLKMMHQSFDAVVNLFFLRQHETGIFNPYRSDW